MARDQSDKVFDLSKDRLFSIVVSDRKLTVLAVRMQRWKDYGPGKQINTLVRV